MNRRNYLALMGAAAGAVATGSKLDLVSAQDAARPAESAAWRAGEPVTPPPSSQPLAASCRLDMSLSIAHSLT